MALPFDGFFSLPTPVVADDIFNTYSSSGATAVADTGVTDPDGNTAAYKITENSATSAHGIVHNQAFANGVTHTILCFMRPAGRNYGLVEGYTVGADDGTYFDLVTPAVGNFFGSGLSNARIDSCANGWFLITGRFVGSGSAGSALVFYAANANSPASYAGNGSSGVHIYAARVYDSALSSATIDTIAAHYAATGGGVSASLATTDRPDATAIATTIANQAQLATTDRPDATAIAVSAAMSTVLSTTDRPDGTAITVDLAVPFSGSFAITDRPDGAALTASLNVFGPLAATEGPDASAFTASLNVFGPLATTDRPDSTAVSANFVVPLSASFAITDLPDGMAVNVVLLGIYAIQLGATEAPDSLAAHACTYPWHTGPAVGGGWRPVERVCG